jgi:UDP-N-acetylglucosamine 4,6-dehydratase (inverting)
MKNFSKILITGGTGSFGQAMVQYICNKYKNIKRLVIFSRDELKQYEMSKKFPQNKYPFIRFFLGDIRDKERLIQSLENIDLVIHAAALKQVPAAEYNPFEFVKTNIIGAQNLIESAFQNNVKQIIALSTDKAAAPINLYGATKLCSDKIFVAANNIKGKRNIKISVVRYGNVMGSRGSVLPLFIEQSKKKLITITHKEMTRFNINMSECVDMVDWLVSNSVGGEILVPKIPSFKLLDLAKAVSAESEIKIIGIRPGEKLHEELITESDATNTYDLGNYYSIVNLEKIKNNYGIKVKNNFSYNSRDNKYFLNIADLNKIIKKFK